MLSGTVRLNALDRSGQICQYMRYRFSVSRTESVVQELWKSARVNAESMMKKSQGICSFEAEYETQQVIVERIQFSKEQCCNQRQVRSTTGTLHNRKPLSLKSY